MKTSITSTLLALSAAAVPALATPTPLQKEVEPVEKRLIFIEGLILSAIVGASSGALKSVIGGEKPLCNQDTEASCDQYWARAYTQDDAGNQKAVAEMCWTSGDYSFTQADADSVACLMNLHINQPTTCIDLEGSSCYVGNLGVGNVRNIKDFDTSPGQQIDADPGQRVAAAIQQMVGREQGWDIGSWMNIVPLNDEGISTGWSIQVRGTGHDDC